MKKYIISFLILVFGVSAYFIFENYQNKDKVIKTVKGEKLKALIISQNNAKVIKLNNKKSNLPFHPVKILLFKNYIFFIDQGKVFKLNLVNSKIVEVKIPYNSHEIINGTVYGNNLYFLDKLNIIHVYNLVNNKFVNKLNFNQYKDIEPQFIAINSSEKINILDNSRNKIFNIEKNQLKEYKQNKSEYISYAADNNLTEAIDFYSENNIFYILEKGNTLKVIGKNSSDEYPLIQKSDNYGYLKITSDKNLKNLYFIGGYNGDIVAISKDTKEVQGIYYVSINKNLLPVYDLLIKNKLMYILAGNYLMIYQNFMENNFNNLKPIDNDLLESSLKFNQLKNIKIPLDNGDSLPIHSSVFPGARRLYRKGIHEGIDFFENVTTLTPVIACKKGIVIRADTNYQEMTKSAHNKILEECRKLGYTKPDIADKLRGRQVVINHSGKIISVYAHLSKANVKVGDNVDEGDIIGFVGNSGTTDGVYKTKQGLHLHFELHIDDKSKNLEYYLGKYLTVEETMQIYRKVFD